jgi:hypothetical protein
MQSPLASLRAQDRLVTECQKPEFQYFFFSSLSIRSLWPLGEHPLGTELLVLKLFGFQMAELSRPVNH